MIGVVAIDRGNGGYDGDGGGGDCDDDLGGGDRSWQWRL